MSEPSIHRILLNLVKLEANLSTSTSISADNNTSSTAKTTFHPQLIQGFQELTNYLQTKATIKDLQDIYTHILKLSLRQFVSYQIEQDQWSLETMKVMITIIECLAQFFSRINFYLLPSINNASTTATATLETLDTPDSRNNHMANMFPIAGSSTISSQPTIQNKHLFVHEYLENQSYYSELLMYFIFMFEQIKSKLLPTSTSSASSSSGQEETKKKPTKSLLLANEEHLLQQLLLVCNQFVQMGHQITCINQPQYSIQWIKLWIIIDNHQLQTKQTILLQYIHMMILFSSSMIAKDLTLYSLQTLCICLQAFAPCSLFWRQSFPGIFSALIKIAHSPIHRTEHILYYTMLSMIYLCQNITNEQNITNKQLFDTCFSLQNTSDNNKNLSESQKNIQNIRSMLQSLSLSSSTTSPETPLTSSNPSTTSQTTTNSTLPACLYEFSSIDAFLSWRINILQRIQKPFVTSYRLIISKLHISHKQQILTQLTSLLSHGYQFLGHICILDFCLCYLELFQDDSLSIRQFAKQSITHLIGTYQTLHASELFWQFKTHFVMILSTLLPSSSTTTASSSSTTTTTTNASSLSIEEIDSSTSSSFMTDLALVQNLKLAIGLGQILSNSTTHLFMLHEHEILLSLEQLFLPDLTHLTTSILSTLDSFTYVLPPFTSSASSMTNELTCTVSYYRLAWKHSRDSRVLSLARAFIMQQSCYWPMNLFEEKLSLKITKFMKHIVCFYLSDSQSFKLSVTQLRKRVTSIISYLWILKYRLFAELTMISKPPKIVCAYCQLPHSTSSTLLRCSRCRQTYYCCQEHQQKHWKQSHKQHCSPCTPTTTNNNNNNNSKEVPKLSLDPLAIDPHHILTQYFPDNIFVLPDSVKETKAFQCHQYNLLKYCHMIHRLLRLYLLAVGRSELISSSSASSSFKSTSSSFFPSSSSSSFLALDDNTFQSKDFGETNGGERYISSLLALIASQALEALADVLFLAPNHDFIIKCLFHNQANDMEYYADLDEDIITQINLSSLQTQSTKSSNTSSISLFFTLIQCIVDRTFPLVSTAALSTFTRLAFYLMANSSTTTQTNSNYTTTTTSPTMSSIQQTKEETNRYLTMFFIQYIDYFIDEAILLLRTQVFMISHSSYLQNISTPLVHISLSNPSLFLPMIESLIEQTRHSTISYLPKEFLEFLFSSRSSSIHLIYSMIKYVFMTCSLQFQELTSPSSSVTPNPMASAMFLLRDLVQETLLHMDHQFSHTQQSTSDPSTLISLSQVRIIVEILGLLTNSIPLNYVSTLQLPSQAITQVFNHKQWNNLTQLLTQTSISPYNPEIYLEIASYVQQKPNIYAMIQISQDMIQPIHSSSELLFNSLINFDFSLQKLNQFPDLSDDDDSNEPNEEEEADDGQENDQETIDLAKESPTIQLLLDIAERTFYTLSFINRFQRSPSDQSMSLSSQDITTLLTIVRSSISILTQVLLRFISFETMLLPFVHKIWKYVLLPRLIDFIEVLNIYTLEKSASLMPTNQSLSIPTHLPSNKSMKSSTISSFLEPSSASSLSSSISTSSPHESNTFLSMEQNISTPKSFCLSLETSELFPTTKNMTNNKNNLPSIASILSSTRNALTRFVEEDHRRRLLYLLPLFFDLLRFMITLTPEFLSQRYQETIFPIFVSIARDYQRLYIQQHAISLVFTPSTAPSTPATPATTSTESNMLQSDQWTKTKLAFVSISKIVFQQSIRSITCQQHQSWIMMIVWFYLTNLSSYETIEIRNQSLQMMIQCAQTNPSFVRHMFSLLIISNPLVSLIVMTAEEEQTFLSIGSSYETFSMEDIEDNWLMIAEEIVRLLHELTPLSTVFAASQPHLSMFKDKNTSNTSNNNSNNNNPSSNLPHSRQHKNVLAKHLLKAYRQDIGIIKACQLILIHLHNNTLSSLSSFTIKTSKEKQPTSSFSSFVERNQEKNHSMNEIHLDDNYQRLLNLWSEI